MFYIGSIFHSELLERKKKTAASSPMKLSLQNTKLRGEKNLLPQPSWGIGWGIHNMNFTGIHLSALKLFFPKIHSVVS